MTAALARVRIAEVLHLARTKNASDVHLRPGSPPVFRIDGLLEMQSTAIADAPETDAVASELLDAAGLEKLRAAGDVTTAYRDEYLGSVRIHAYRTAAGTALAVRLLAQTVPTLESLHLPPVVCAFADRSHGLILLAGPTGSGKSTAVAAIVDRINRTQNRHVITLEDPIEYVHTPRRSVITQREIGRDVFTFAEAIYGALRSDPDVILVGEMREPATIQAALTAAETGHLVLATLHTSDASQTVDRIISTFSGAMQEQARAQLAQTLAAAMCMRLVRRAGGEGRRAAAEILIANDAVRNVIREGKAHHLRNIISTSRQIGMQTLEAHLSDLVAHREIALDEARSVTERPSEIACP